MSKERILITGAGGQIGTALRKQLIEKWGADSVLSTDIHYPSEQDPSFEKLNVLDKDRLADLCRSIGVTQIYHLAAILSGNSEKNPRRSWDTNMEGLLNILEIALESNARVFYPSSIAVFGRKSPPQHTPQHTTQEPETIYGISKVAGEGWCRYFHHHFGLDVRSLRFPGLISYDAPAGGGTTDYAVDIFHKAVSGHPFTCFLKAETRLPMLYMPDAIRATIELMDAESKHLTVRTSYNLSGFSFSPVELFRAIQQYVPDFEIRYEPDFRQAIADSWPESIDDSQARKDWGWHPNFNLDAMTQDMLIHLGYPVEVAR